jgi:hypothetical protein
MLDLNPRLDFGEIEMSLRIEDEFNRADVGASQQTPDRKRLSPQVFTLVRRSGMGAR